MSVLFYRLAYLFYMIYLRVLCKTRGLDYFHTCPHLFVENKKITLLTILVSLVHILCPLIPSIWVVG
jgi:hypothetical protein